MGFGDMKLLRFEQDGAVRLGVLREDGIVSLDGLAARFPTMMAIVASGGDALVVIAEHVQAATETLALESVRLLAPIERPGKYLAIGMNYRKHIVEAERLGVAEPKQQFWFNKQTSCIVGPYDDTDPGVTEKLDYEVELCAVIGRPAKSVSEADAAAHVFGYTVANDISARDWQMHSPTFMIGKSFDTHGPIGPWIVTADEIADPHALNLRCIVNGKTRQSSDTGQMVNNIWAQIAYLSTAMTLESGDLLATGTPEGVGAGMQPPRFLQPGDVVRCEIDGIGAIENRVVSTR
jgi:2-keto-4-pentenoate hydratase/2-oxohepta-3-ene-1,7-dioic acid hydratase in catechol pathway